MKIVFLLPGAGATPVGGYKVVYEYANGLSRLGNQVTIMHSPHSSPGEGAFLVRLRRMGSFCTRLIGLKGGYKPTRWFIAERNVRYLWRPSLRTFWIPPADVCIAASWDCAELLASYPPSKGRKFYLIQHLDSYFSGVDKNRVEATWKLPLKKIVIAKWLQDHARAMGEESVYVPNGLDFEWFNLDTPLEDREPARVLMLHHTEAWKGSAVGLDALNLVRQTTPTLTVDLFGISPPPNDLPSWINYHRNPTQTKLRTLYNTASIFVAPSFAEGWGLPASEAMQCGCALCATDIGGHREFAIHDATALLSPAGDVQRLAEHIQLLIRDDARRQRIARDGNEFIRQFTWPRAVNTVLATIDH